MKRLIITEEERKRILNLHEKKKINEGLGMTLLILTGLGIFNLIRIIRKFFLNIDSKIPNIDIVHEFLHKLYSIEEGRMNGKVYVEVIDGDYLIKIETEKDGDSKMLVDSRKQTIYSDETKSLQILPVKLEDGKKLEDSTRAFQNGFINAIVKVVNKYGEKA